MKDSGIEWIGEIPEWWNLIKGRFLFRQRSERGNKIPILLSPTQKYGVIPQSELEGIVKLKEETDLQELRTVHKGDYIISLRSFQGGFELSNLEGVCSPAYQVFFSIHKNINHQFFKYLFKSETFIRKINNLTVGIREGKNILYSDFSNMELPIPPLPEQTAIANYLDKQCASIDTVIEKEQQVIEKLTEYKQSVITEAVTKGLNPDVPMKDSGIEWIGEIPAGWLTPKLKYLATITSGGTPDRNVPSYWNGSINWLKTGELQNNELFDSQEKITELGLANSSARIFPIGTILMALYGQGKTRGMTGLLKVPCATNQACAGICVTKTYIDIIYLWKFLISAYNVIRERANGSGQPNLSGELISNLEIVLPPLSEQKAIADYLDKKCAAINNVITQKQKLIDKLTEYKKSLIYEMVTGKKEVPLC